MNLEKVIHFYAEFQMFHRKICCLYKWNWNFM